MMSITIRAETPSPVGVKSAAQLRNGLYSKSVKSSPESLKVERMPRAMELMNIP
jgi:hypothetical protein